MVHNDYYTNEVPPKFEIFADRIEITSAGRLPMGLSQTEFFNGVSAPRNKELMRIFRDVNMVEALGSGMARIRKAYSKKIYTFSENFIKTTVVFHTQKIEKDTGKDTELQAISKTDLLLAFCITPQSMKEMMQYMHLQNRASFIRNYIKPLISLGKLAMTIPEQPSSRNQRYIAVLP